MTAHLEGAEPALRVEDLTVEYPGKPPRVAVRGANLTVPVGGSLALVGPSGSGKSSLLLAIAGVIEAEGRVSSFGRRIDELPAHRRGIGMVFQDGQLFPHLDVGGNVGFGLRMAGIGGDEREIRVVEVLELVGLAGFEGREISALSGGERQRVALARTLAPGPKVVLLDEPLSSLDQELRERLAVEVPAVLRRAGASWIVVTHDPREAEAMADRVVRMDDGQLTTDAQTNSGT